LNQLNCTEFVNCLSLGLTVSAAGFYRPGQGSGFDKLSAKARERILIRQIGTPKGATRAATGRAEIEIVSAPSPAIAGLPPG
jgi:hypothetical protein